MGLPISHARMRQKLTSSFCSKSLLPKPLSKQARIISLSWKVHVTPLLKPLNGLLLKPQNSWNLRIKFQIFNKSYRICPNLFLQAFLYPVCCVCFQHLTLSHFLEPANSLLPQGSYPARLPSPHLAYSYPLFSSLLKDHFLQEALQDLMSEPPVISSHHPMLLGCMLYVWTYLTWNMCLSCQSSQPRELHGVKGCVRPVLHPQCLAHGRCTIHVGRPANLML